MASDRRQAVKEAGEFGRPRARRAPPQGAVPIATAMKFDKHR